MSFDGVGESGGVGGARTAASKRMQSEREAREAAQAAVQLTKDQQQQQQQSQAQHQSRPLQQQQQQAPLAPYQRPSIPMASALGGEGENISRGNQAKNQKHIVPPFVQRKPIIIQLEFIY